MKSDKSKLLRSIFVKLLDETVEYILLLMIFASNKLDGKQTLENCLKNVFFYMNIEDNLEILLAR